MLRQNAEYSRNPHDDTAGCRHLPMVPVARAARNTASSSWVSAYAASPATRSTSGIPPHAPATAACTAPALLAGAPVRPCEASARRKAPQQPVRRILEATGLIDVFSANPSMGQAASSARHAGHGHRRRRDGPVPPWLPDRAAGGRHAALPVIRWTSPGCADRDTLRGRPALSGARPEKGCGLTDHN